MAIRIGDEVELADGTWCVVVGVSESGEAILRDPWGNLLETSQFEPEAERNVNGPRTHDARRGPRCAEPGCLRARLWLGGDQYVPHCQKHASSDELEEYYRAWSA